MVAEATSETVEVPTFCPLCISRCGAMATVTDGALVALRADPLHPTGSAICVKGKAAPELVAHSGRLLHPMRRTRPKGEPDPGWEQITWDEALATIAAKLTAARAEHGPRSVVFATASPSTTAMSDAIDWVMRLRESFGIPNIAVYMELCGYGRTFAPMFTFGAPVPSAFMPDIERAACILFWGYNPSTSWLDHATATAAAVRRGAKLVVIDPRKAGLASKADHWLRPRPGTDGALALSMVGVMLANGWYDEGFVRHWTNAPLLVRADDGRLLNAADAGCGPEEAFCAWDSTAARAVAYDPKSADYAAVVDDLALRGTFEIELADGRAAKVRPILDQLAEHAAEMSPAKAADITGVDADAVVEAARTIWESGPVAFYTWSGLEQQSNVTQTIRAIDVLYALTGSLDAPGGNVMFGGVPSNPPSGFPPRAADVGAIGSERYPMGPPGFGFVTGLDLYEAAAAGEVAALMTFGANLVMAHGDSDRGRVALANVDFIAHADLFMTPTAELADIVLPIASPWEVDALRVGWETTQKAKAHVQLRQALVDPRGECRSDLQVIFGLAENLGLADAFFGGDIEAAWAHQLAPSGLTLEQLRAEPRGITLPIETKYRKYEADGRFRTPTGKIELYSLMLASAQQPALPTFVEPGMSPRSQPSLAAQFPLVLSCAKSTFFRETQDRALASLRKLAPDPILEVHPDTAGARGIAAGDWVLVSTPTGDVRARAKFNANLDPGVVFGQHGWWQACEDLGLPGHEASANLNAVLRQEPADPISGSSPLRAWLCEVTRLDQ